MEWEGERKFGKEDMGLICFWKRSNSSFLGFVVVSEFWIKEGKIFLQISIKSNVASSL